MELRRYFSLFSKWAWLSVLTLLIGVGTTYYYSLSISPAISAENTLLVGLMPQDRGTGPNTTQSSSNLAAAYARLITQPPILQAAALAIQWP